VLITAICPHMLTARPLVLPSSATVDVKVPEKVRTLPIVSFDGMNEQELERGEHVENLLKKIIVSSVEDRTRIYVFISEWAFVKYQ
jgi:NAD kinase